MTSQMRSDFSRVWLLENRASPAVKKFYEGLWRAGAFTFDQGDVKFIKIPDPNAYGAFVTSGKIIGEPKPPQIAVQARYTDDLSDLMRLARRECDHDIQIHMGKCRNPQDFNLGWDKILVLEAAKITTYKTDDLGALTPENRDILQEDATFVGERAYEIKRLEFEQFGSSITVREITDIAICDSFSCGLCGLPSDGCQVVLAASLAQGGSPGYLAKVIWTKDGGSTWFDTVLAGAGATEDITSIRCVGSNVVVVTTAGVYYMPLTQLFAQTGTWTKVTTGLVLAAGAPRYIHSASPSFTWIVGAGGYIYFTQDPTSSVSVQDAAQATTQQLNWIHGADLQNLVAVGNNNAVVFTRDGGLVWDSIAGPIGGVNLNSVFMKSPDEWWVTAASGRLFYTRDAGATWSEKLFPGSGAGVARSVYFVNNTVGYLTHDTATPVARVLRTIDGGASWYVAPEGSGQVPNAQRFNAVVACDSNTVFAGGLGSGTYAGELVKGS